MGELPRKVFQDGASWIRNNILLRSSQTFDLSKLTVSFQRLDARSFAAVTPTRYGQMPRPTPGAVVKDIQEYKKVGRSGWCSTVFAESTHWDPLSAGGPEPELREHGLDGDVAARVVAARGLDDLGRCVVVRADEPHDARRDRGPEREALEERKHHKGAVGVPGGHDEVGARGVDPRHAPANPGQLPAVRLQVRADNPGLAL